MPPRSGEALANSPDYHVKVKRSETMMASTSTSGYHVIVGGLGMLGRALQKELLAQGKKVRVLDIIPLGKATESRLEGTSEYVSCRLSPSCVENLKEALKDADTVYNVATPDVFSSTAAEMQRTNVDGVQLLVDICSLMGVPKLVHASSMGATNHLRHHHEESEAVPLPPWDTYRIAYDRTKRLGEEIVLKQPNKKLQTCALRLGGILAGPGDYITRTFFFFPGRIIVPQDAAPKDFISARDVARALFLASQKMDSKSNLINGRTINITKCKATSQPASATTLMAKYAEEMGWNTTHVPQSAMMLLCWVVRVLQTVRLMLTNPTDETRLGCSLDLSIEILYHEMTYDNSQAKELLGFEPQDTWEDAVVRISQEFREQYPEWFHKRRLSSGSIQNHVLVSVCLCLLVHLCWWLGRLINESSSELMTVVSLQGNRT